MPSLQEEKGHGCCADEKSILAAEKVRFSYHNSGFELGPVDLALEAGEILGIIGPNGSGKTTMLRLLSGFLRPESGRLYLNGGDIRHLKPHLMAKILGFVPSQSPATFPFRSIEIVMMGRLPHLPFLRSESSKDEDIARRAMGATDTAHLADRYFNELSGGERQRVMIAMSLAQEPSVLLLDEPTSHLDISHIVTVFDVLVSLARDSKMAIALVLHDLNLASEYCDKLLLMRAGKVEALGRPDDVLSVENIKSVFRAEVAIHENPATGAPFVFPVSRHRR
ncbi:MAG: ABC transporter ATP-binding protein [Candidatus Coatesbacteria bacterium]|nr:ABC transporter ATP-binding protein [Candidatus Coatesbacteria bacterium]